jgi:3-hydroxyisobutyrate dehydrogenase-like beta-hydroxyacid dehydrogenase
MIISLVTPGVAIKVAAEAAAALRHGIYIDFNSISPKEKQGIAARFGEHRYVDGAILGSIAGEGSRVKLALSGTRANNARSRLSTLGFNASTVGSQVGAASGVKMCRSIFMKGLECLFVETLVASETFQVTDNVLRSIEETFRAYQLRPMADMLVTTHAAHCRRRSDEMRSAAKMMDQMGIPNRMSKATRDFLAASSRSGVVDHFRGSVPSTSKEVTDYFLDAPRRTRR